MWGDLLMKPDIASTQVSCKGSDSLLYAASRLAVTARHNFIVKGPFDAAILGDWQAYAPAKSWMRRAPLQSASIVSVVA